MHLVADDEPLTVLQLRPFVDSELGYVECDATERPVAYLLLRILDGWLNIEQVSVHPSYHRRGIGRKLIDVADQISLDRGLAGLTLTTFVEVPWNGP